MLGLVLWSDPKRRKALIWCEDQSDLAYFDGAREGEETALTDVGEASVVPSVGDMLVFDICHSGQLRRATNVRALSHKAADDLIDKLKAAGRSAMTHSTTSAQAANQKDGGDVVCLATAREAKVARRELAV